MIVGNHLRQGVFNNNHTSALFQSDTTDGSTTFACTARGNADSHGFTVSGQTHHETDYAKFGATSIEFDGSGDHWDTTPSGGSDDWDLTVIDFCVDFWLNTANWDPPSYLWTIATPNKVTSATYASLTDWLIMWEDADKRMSMRLCADGYEIANAVTGPHGVLTANTWYHFAWQRRGDTHRGYQNGVPFAADGDLSGFTPHRLDVPLEVGAWGGWYDLDGFIDEFRIVRGQLAFPWGGFTPPNRMS